ncbi:MAG: GNAT family N-acetyltransferase [Tissierellia bacterium]|nr:GNAT family N-acetyltransferase [Tissierellia bacterium]
MTSEIKYIGKFTSEINNKEKEDFLYVFNTVFDLDYDLNWFDWKYVENPYGESYIVFAYENENIAAIRAFWRNDIDNNLSYQPCDTAVLKKYRGMGIFSKMTKLALDKVEDAFIYNFPNENSLPGYLKIGWEINKYGYLEKVISKSNLREKTKYIEDDYLIWKFSNSPLNKYYYTEIKGDFYLLTKRKNNIYYVLGRFNGEYRDNFKEAGSTILFNYTTEETMMYKFFKNRATIVSYKGNKKDLDIPIFKGDFF